MASNEALFRVIKLLLLVVFGQFVVVLVLTYLLVTGNTFHLKKDSHIDVGVTSTAKPP